MIPPLISYVTFNRLGLTALNLPDILKSPDDFEMHIIDNNSADDTWAYIQSLKDERIKTKARIDVNAGQIYAININLAKRRPEQYFFNIDNDVRIETPDFLTKFMEVFNTFPDVGLLGLPRDFPTPLPPTVPKVQNSISYLEINNSIPNTSINVVPSCLMGIRPELLNEIGYFCEENYFGDIELSNRVLNFTPYKAGFVNNVSIKMPQIISCEACPYKERCTMDKIHGTCFDFYQKYDKNDEFRKKYKWMLEETIKDMQRGTRSVYCASSADAASTSNHTYNLYWVLENVNYFIKNANQ